MRDDVGQCSGIVDMKKKQTEFSHSTMEEEFIAALHAGSELLRDEGMF